MVRRNELTTRSVATAKTPGMYLDGQGLYLRVSATGTRSWIFKFALNGRTREMGIGPFPDVSLAVARDRAHAQRLLKLDWTDPIEHRRQTRATQSTIPTFEQAAAAYIAAHQQHRWHRDLARHVYPKIGALPVDKIDLPAVLRVLEPIWATRTHTASRLRGRLERILAAVTVQGHRSGDNPARWRGHLAELLQAPTKAAPTTHRPALPYSELPAFIASLRAKKGTIARAINFLILTAARSGEVTGATWSEIDFKGRLWTIPPARMKSSREHRVPLSEPALAILAAIPRRTDFVFPGRQTRAALSERALYTMLRKYGYGCSIHGFRSTFRDWAAEETNTAPEVAEMALAHAVGDKVEAAYRRGDLFQKRRQLSEDWANFCSGEKPDATVVDLRPRSA
jgi:integrase